MKSFLDDNFLLHTKTSQQLYHDFAKNLPIVDYHNHLPPNQIATDYCFENLTQAWLYGDHYKWRAMRANGVHESYITGNKSDYEKFEQWAATVPCTLRNPLYHWTHLELQRYFDVNGLLSPATAKSIYADCSAKLASKEYSVLNLLRKMKVEMLCTTDDPIDDLVYHKQVKAANIDIKVLPAFRPDKSFAVEDPVSFNKYIGRLEEASGITINTLDALLEALHKRMDYFEENGCMLSDHGLEKPFSTDYSQKEVAEIFIKARAIKSLQPDEIAKFKSAVLFELGKMYHARQWVQQYHIGAIRNNNPRTLHTLGADTGFDSIGSNISANELSKFLGRLDKEDKLAKTVLYNLNPADNAMVATMVGNFNDGSVAGKIQWGSAWWFLDQKDGMTEQINTLSNMGLLSRFAGMLTDSRSFLSFPRHEYFRRILCNIFGEEIERGELPGDIAWTGKIIEDICYHNIKQYLAH
ncbi:MAG TPA: glucuronate isomerase [Chitinophagaceae bacterium]|nr:glucuronate isomerase [Chitinophagaceae bacterium]